ncbi:MAG: hypothetical protein HOP11_13740, partial [Saprospiraceae bacterium]|nr:hypothetical protein [Saprospiraceae bacterium]
IVTLEEKIKILTSESAEISKANKTKDEEIVNLNKKIEDLDKTLESQNNQILELSKKASKSKSKNKKQNLTDSLIIKNSRILELETELSTANSTLNSFKSSKEESLKKSEQVVLEVNSRNDSIRKENANLVQQVILLNAKNQELISASNTKTGKTKKNTVSTKPISETETIAITGKDPKKDINQAETNNTANSEEKILYAKPSAITDETIIKIQKIISENEWPGMSVRKEDNSAVIVVPQTFVFLNETLALNEEGSRLIMRILNALNNIKQNDIDIVVYSESGTFTDEFNLNRARTISKLFKALGAPANNLNTGSRLYVPEEDVNNFKEGVELIIRPL